VIRLANSAVRRISVMIHAGRVGSSALAGALSSLPLICAGEIFTDSLQICARLPSGISFAEKLQFCFDNAEALGNHYTEGAPVGIYPKSAYMFEFKPFHPNMPTFEHALKMFVDGGVTHFIYLSRRNYLRRLVSFIVARESGVWHSGTTPDTPFQVYLDPQYVIDNEIGFEGGTLANAIKAYETFDSRMRCGLKALGLPVLSLTYEDDIESDVVVAFERVRQFLELPLAPVFNSGHARTNPYPLPRIILNFEAVKQYLKDVGCSYLLA
jgi:hypothetical protein